MSAFHTLVIEEATSNSGGHPVVLHVPAAAEAHPERAIPVAGFEMAAIGAFCPDEDLVPGVSKTFAEVTTATFAVVWPIPWLHLRVLTRRPSLRHGLVEAGLCLRQLLLERIDGLTSARS